MNFATEEAVTAAPYALPHAEKAVLYRRALGDLTRHHYERCEAYRLFLQKLRFDPYASHDAKDFPMLPVRIFKMRELLSTDRTQIVKTMTSSGTSGQAVSKIFLDRENVRAQTRTLASIIGDFIGKKRLPLLILDTEQVKKDRAMFSARGAGIIGFSTFGKDILYALDADMQIDVPAVEAFLEKHRDSRILMFGYTYMIWQYVVKALEARKICLFAKDAVLFHIGGWKKIKEQAVSTVAYNKAIENALGNVRVHNYYGMAEQLGSVFVECEHGHLHCSNYSDVFIRRPGDFSLAGLREKGLIELVSLLPTSYPGHILLTEDEGEVLGEDDCPCGRMGKYFKIHGRMKGAELRGCSDTYERH